LLLFSVGATRNATAGSISVVEDRGFRDPAISRVAMTATGEPGGLDPRHSRPLELNRAVRSFDADEVFAGGGFQPPLASGEGAICMDLTKDRRTCWSSEMAGDDETADLTMPAPCAIISCLSMLLMGFVWYGLRRGRKPDPTPEQIARACREIRATWSERTRRARRLGLETVDEEDSDLALWTPQVVPEVYMEESRELQERELRDIEES
jgi:hypothetical protein